MGDDSSHGRAQGVLALLEGIDEPPCLLDLVLEEGHSLAALTALLSPSLVLLQHPEVGRAQAQGGYLTLLGQEDEELTPTLGDDEVRGEVC